jgi:hypothetical protein
MIKSFKIFESERLPKRIGAKEFYQARSYGMADWTTDERKKLWEITRKYTRANFSISNDFLECYYCGSSFEIIKTKDEYFTIYVSDGKIYLADEFIEVINFLENMNRYL